MVVAHPLRGPKAWSNTVLGDPVRVSYPAEKSFFENEIDWFPASAKELHGSQHAISSTGASETLSTVLVASYESPLIGDQTMGCSHVFLSTYRPC